MPVSVLDSALSVSIERPDGLVMVIPATERGHAAHTGTLGRLKEEGTLPIDTVFVGGGTPTLSNCHFTVVANSPRELMEQLRNIEYSRQR